MLPLALPGIVAGSIFTFSLTLGDYITPLLVGGGSQFIGHVVYANVGIANDVPFAAAFAIVPMLVMAVYLFDREAPRRVRGAVVESRGTRIALVAWTALVVLFLLFPLVLIGVYAFNKSNVQSWPITEFSTKWLRVAWRNQEMRDALWLSVRVGAFRDRDRPRARHRRPRSPSTASSSSAARRSR